MASYAHRRGQNSDGVLLCQANPAARLVASVRLRSGVTYLTGTYSVVRLLSPYLYLKKPTPSLMGNKNARGLKLKPPFVLICSYSVFSSCIKVSASPCCAVPSHFPNFSHPLG